MSSPPETDLRHATWVVAKFGGTSVASALRWHKIDTIVRRHLAAGHRVLLVSSAVSGVTDRLVSIADAVDAGADPTPIVKDLERVHARLGEALGVDAAAIIGVELASLGQTIAEATPGSPRDRARVLAHGERMATRIGAAWLISRGLAVHRADARDLLEASPAGDVDRAERFLSASCPDTAPRDVAGALDAVGVPVVVTEGFVARDPDGETVLLGRGGSDASAAYLAAAVDAARLEVWSDVPGIFTADPRIVPSARLLRRVAYAEAAALAALGGKVLHPRTIEPCRRRGVPIHLGWTERPELEGTRIGAARAPSGVKAITARRKLALVTMARPPAWQPVGFLAEVAARFQRRGLSIDLIASSPSEIRATIDLAAFPSAADDLSGLAEDLAGVCTPRITTRVASVSLIGTRVAAAATTALDGAGPVHLVAHGARGSHVTHVVDDAAVDRAIAAAHAALLDAPADDTVFGPRWTDLTAPAAAAPARSGREAAA